MPGSSASAKRLSQFRYGLTKPDFTGLWGEAWGLMKSRYWLLVGVVSVAAVISWFAAMVLGMIPLIGGMVGQVFIVTPLTIGALWFAVCMARGQPVTFGLLWIGFNRYKDVLIVGLVGVLAQVAMTALPVAFAMLFRGGAGTSLPVGIILVVLGLATFAAYIFFATRLWLANSLVMDPEVGGWSNGGRPLTGAQAVVASWDLSRTIFWMLLGQGVLVWVLSFACMMLLLLPVLLLAFPLAAAVHGVMYTRIIRAISPDICHNCGYALTGIVGPVCTECGQTKPVMEAPRV